jgi:hypothetical protein
MSYCGTRMPDRNAKKVIPMFDAEASCPDEMNRIRYRIYLDTDSR